METNVRKEERQLRIGVLGCGLIGQAAHLVGCAKAKNVHLQAICDVSAELRNKMAMLYEPDSVYGSYEEMLADRNVDAVIIGIGDQFHVPCAMQAVQAGKPVLVEKPMGVSLEECEQLRQLTEEKKVLLQVGHMKRFDPGIQFAKQFRDEQLGRVTVYKGWYCDSVGRYTLTDNVMPVIYSSREAKKPAGNPKQILDRYYLLSHGSHLFDTAMYFMGPIRAVSARLCKEEGLYSWLIDCSFANGSIGVLDLSVAIAQKWHEGCEIYGTEGTVYVKTYNPWEFRASEVECYSRATDTSVSPAAYDGQVYRREIEAFADSVLYQKPCAGATAEDGIAIMRALIATYQSVQEDGRWISLDQVSGGL